MFILNLVTRMQLFYGQVIPTASNDRNFIILMADLKSFSIKNLEKKQPLANTDQMNSDADNIVKNNLF